MLKLSENPAILTPQVQSLTELSGTWWVAHTKARFEKVFAWDMSGHGIGYFLPMREKIFFSGGRKRRAMMPLFTSYVFVCGTEPDRYTALTTNRLCQMIDVIDQEGLIRELSRIERALLSGAVVDHYPHLPVGNRCRIIFGPMMGTEGVVVERRDEKARMVLDVTILGQNAVVEVDADLLAPVERHQVPNVPGRDSSI
jgi:transcriptional antiterminator RfaH